MLSRKLSGERWKRTKVALVTLLAQSELTIVHLFVPQQDLHEQQERFQTLLKTLGKASRTETESILAERALAEPEEGLTEELRVQLQRKFTLPHSS